MYPSSRHVDSCEVHRSTVRCLLSVRRFFFAHVIVSRQIGRFRFGFSLIEWNDSSAPLRAAKEGPKIYSETVYRRRKL